DTHSSESSATESLLGRPSSPALHTSSRHAYPPAPLEKPPLLPNSSSQQQSPSHSRITIPTREAVLAAQLYPKRRPRHPRIIVLGLTGLVGFAWIATQLLSLGTRFGGPPKLQVILMISDGMGPASETMGRTYLQYLRDTKSASSNYERTLLNESVWAGLAAGFEGRAEGMGVTPLDEMLTRSSNSLVTDSAAGATAFACTLKTYNGAIGVTPSKTPCGTILEAAKRQGFSTGLVATSRLTHATPASFYAHVVDRDLESEIASFLIGDGPQGQTVDFALGGGRCFFVGNGTQGSCRTDGKDLLAKAKEKGIKVLDGMQALRQYHEEADGAHAGTVLGLLSDDHMDYEVDRQSNTVLAQEQPSLKEMSTYALKYLRQAGAQGKGFFLIIEGSRIDMAGHNNDPIAHVSDMLAYYQTVQYVKRWVDNQNEEGTPTMLVSVSDHETGGLALGRQLTDEYPEYLWYVALPITEKMWEEGLTTDWHLRRYPDVLINATHSTSYLGSLVASRYPSTTRDWVQTEIYEKGLGIMDVAGWELDQLWMNRTDAYRANRVLADAVRFIFLLAFLSATSTANCSPTSSLDDLTSLEKVPLILSFPRYPQISRRGQVGWSTVGHSGVDVNLYAAGYNSTGLTGNVENIDIGEHIAHNMGLNLDVVTIELNQNLQSWFSDTLGQSTSRTSLLKHYHGDL
ncbi:SPOSA6832_03716, partial [Sporobolomyces salmonicolor]